jgi:hypothetical protein
VTNENKQVPFQRALFGIQQPEKVESWDFQTVSNLDTIVPCSILIAFYLI